MATLLDAINHLLGVMGEAPVSDENSTHPTVITAKVQLARVSREMQSTGWWFNEDYNLKLMPNMQGQVIVPANQLSIFPVNTRDPYVVRGNKFYDPVNHTYEIKSPIYVDLISLLPMDDLPETASAYIMHKAAYDTYVNDDGDEEKSNRLLMEYSRAREALRNEELKQRRPNSNTRPAVANLRYRTRQYGLSFDPRWPGGRP